MNKNLEEFLKTYTKGEKWHLEHPGELSKRYEEIPFKEINNQKCYYFDFSNSLRSKNMAIVKESRFTKIPPHFHKDMELNYIFSGECDFLINNHQIKMTEGDLCILDPNIVHSATNIKKENDIVFNFVFKREFFNSVFLSRLKKGVVSNFIFEILSKSNSYNNFLFFHTSKNERFKTLIEYLLTEYYFPSSHDQDLIDVYTNAIFIELLNCEYETQYWKNNNEIDKIFPILEYIQLNYKTCDLNAVANEFCYSPNYLSSLLKKVTGKSFIDLKQEQQLTEFTFLLTNTSKNINDIIDKVGCTNYRFLYKKFESIYNMTPKQYRKKYGTS